jgi:hypothetical protein
MWIFPGDSSAAISSKPSWAPAMGAAPVAWRHQGEHHGMVQAGISAGIAAAIKKDFIATENYGDHG